MGIASMTNGRNLDIDEYRNKHIRLDVDGVKKSKHCRYYFAVHPYTYGKVRMTAESNGKTPSSTISHPPEYDKLYFAAIPPFHSSKSASKTPMRTFQYGLSRLGRPSCEVCKGIRNQNDPSLFPVLRVPRRTKNFGGSWVTKACTAADDTTFQTDYYNFNHATKTSGTFAFHENMFTDADCKIKLFNIKTGGTFENNGQTPGLRGVHTVSLTVTRLSMTIFSETTLSLVRNNRCGDPKKWRIGVEQNLTQHNGCPILGFVVPASLKTLIRVTKNKHMQEFYITPIDPSEKGTFFSHNLVSCDSVIENFKARLTTTGVPEVTRRRIPVITDFNPEWEREVVSDGRRSGGRRLTCGGFLVCIFLSIVYCLS